MAERRKHIAVLCDYRLFPERVGGMDHFFWRFDAECTAKGIEVDWFFPNAATHGAYDTLNIYPAEKSTIEKTFLGHFKHKKPNYSHIITHFLEICTGFFKKAKQLTKAQIISIDHNPRPLKGHSFKKRIKKRLKGAIYSRYIDVFVGVSKYTVQELKKDFGNHIESKCTVIYNGVVIEDIKEREQSNQPPRFVVVSHLRKSKGIQDLIKAVTLLPDSIRKILKIDLYGEGSYRKELEQRAEKEDVSINFNFKGSSSRISSVFYNYDYLLHPTHMECFSLTLLESLAANVPVITTPVGGNLEIVEDKINGFIVPVENPELLADMLVKVYTGELIIEHNTRSKIAAEFRINTMVNAHLKLIS
ncbi:glycosyltransferase family 4 protein [Flavimarina sp. Hel_I_48]|uniref:glycosyltransferase family 4 protein n=1 Tax=Flavimarina sp. Hel_I_48 TaxID=1392488 RepID=UPI0004DEF00C|nr:glycosyltransferase family 4 protein [Flavimarina sp. Hel_I_48]